MSQTPFFGVFENADGSFTDLFSGSTLTAAQIKPNRKPFYGRFIDKDGIEHDIREITGGSGAVPRIGENGNWWIGDTDTGVVAEGRSASADLPWCSGDFAERSLNLTTWSVLVPIIKSGDTAMVRDTAFIVSNDGIYALFFSGGTVSTAATLTQGISLNDSTGGIANNRILSFGLPNIQGIPPINTMSYFHAGDLLYHSIHSSLAQSTVTGAGTNIRRFLYIRIR